MSGTKSNDNPEVASFQLGDYIIDIPSELQDKVLINNLFQESYEGSHSECDSWGNLTTNCVSSNVTCKSSSFSFLGKMV